MNTTLLDVFIAIILACLCIFLVYWFLKYLANASERRMMRMLSRAGVDMEIAKRGDYEAIIQDIRQRCRKCQTEDVCERWLAGEEDGDNTFCPNQQVFHILKEDPGKTS